MGFMCSSEISYLLSVQQKLVRLGAFPGCYESLLGAKPKSGFVKQGLKFFRQIPHAQHKKEM